MMVFGFLFGPSPTEIVLIAGSVICLLLPEVHRAFCYCAWLARGDARWLDPDECWEIPRWKILLMFWFLFALAIICVVTSPDHA